MHPVIGMVKLWFIYTVKLYNIKIQLFKECLALLCNQGKTVLYKQCKKLKNHESYYRILINYI